MKVTLRISIGNTYNSDPDSISGSISISGRKIHRGTQNTESEVAHVEKAFDELKAYLLHSMMYSE